MRLRDYQEAAIESIEQKFETNDSLLLLMCTGSGKTVVFTHLFEDYCERGRVMVLAHREELIGQAYRAAETITGISPDTEMGEYRATTGTKRSDIVVATIQTMISGSDGYRRMYKFQPDDFSLLVHDECHHSVSPSHQKVIDYFRQNKSLKTLGVTATSSRLDGKSLGKIFDDVAYQYELWQAIEDGYLVPIEVESITVEGLDYSDVRPTATDLNGKDLARELEREEILHGFAWPIIEKTDDKKTLIFTASVWQAERLCEILNRHKPKSARWICGKTPKEERRAMWPAYAGGDFQYLVNVGVVTEGVDVPGIECVVLARPTRSVGLCSQMIGRAVRALPGVVDDCVGADARKLAIASSRKPSALILDFVGNCGRLDLVNPIDILGGRYADEEDGSPSKIIERAKKNAAEKDEPANVMDELEIARRQLEEEAREEELQKARRILRLRAQYRTEKIDPFKCLKIKRWPGLARNQGRPPSEKQIAFLERLGVNTEGFNFSEAQQIIGNMIGRMKRNMATFKQIALLERFGYETNNLTKNEATELITKLKENGWKRPA